MNEAYKLAAWLRANAKHMGSKERIDQMLRSAMVMELLADKEKPGVQKQKIIRSRKTITVSDLWR
jgi:nicotinic acid mononucleotide adenylyltransferase